MNFWIYHHVRYQTKASIQEGLSVKIDGYSTSQSKFIGRWMGDQHSKFEFYCTHILTSLVLRLKIRALSQFQPDLGHVFEGFEANTMATDGALLRIPTWHVGLAIVSDKQIDWLRRQSNRCKKNCHRSFHHFCFLRGFSVLVAFSASWLCLLLSTSCAYS